MAQETTTQKIVKRVMGEMDSAPSRELILAQIASNRAVVATLKKFKSGIEISDSNRSVFE